MSNANISHTAQQTGQTQHTWIFQANPLLYQIEQSLRVEQEDKWNLRQHHRRIQVGDRVLIWISGKHAGIYAVGKVLTSPTVEPDSAKGIGYWIDKRQGYRAISRVNVRYERVMLDRPLLRDFLLCDPSLWTLSILRNPRGTNFAVTETEWQALKTWLDM